MIKKIGYKITIAICNISDTQAGWLYIGIAALILILAIL